MRIITKEERGRSYEPSFTIISRIKSPVEQMLALLPPRPSWTPNFLGRRTETIPIRKEETSSSRTSTTSFNSYSPSHNASNLIIIGEAEPVIEDQRHVETSRKYDGLFTVEKGMVRYRMSSQPDNLGGNGHYHGSESPATFGLWEMMKMRRPQKWDALNKLLPSSQSTTEREEPAATTQPSTTTTTSTTPLSWNAHESGNHESFHRLENDDSVLVTDINSRTTTIFPTTSATGSQQEIPDATTTAANGSQSEEEESSIHRSTTSTQPITAAPHSSWLVVRVDDSTCYAATDSFAHNGTVVFKRFQLAELSNQSGWTDLSNIEKYFPGFGRIAGTKPNRLIVRTIIVADEDEEQLTDQEEEEQYYFITPQSVHTDTTIEHQTVSIVSSNSSLFTDEIMSSHNESNDEANAVPHHLESLNSFGFRKVDDDKPAVNSVEPGNNNAETAADHLLAMNLTVVADDVSNVTAMPFISNEEQMTPPLLKTLENLLLTHLLPSMTSSSSMSSSPISSSSSAPSNFTLPPPTSSSTTTSSYHFMFDHSPLTSTTSTTPAATSFTSSTTSPTTTSTADSYFSWLLHHEPVQSINDWPIVSQLIEPAHMTSTYPPSTTVLPTKKMMQSPAHYDPAINKATLSSHSMIISSRNPSLSQPIIPSYPLRQTSSAITEKPLPPSPIQMFTLKPENEAPKFITNKPISSKKNTGLASLILAHTSALMSGQNSPFLNDMRRSTNSSSDVRQTKTNSNFLPEPVPITATVHVIVASPYPDPEHEEELNRRRSLDSRVRNNNKNSIITGNSSWAFPSFTQLIESPDLLSSTKTSSPVIRPVNATPVSSFNGNIDDDLPSLPRFSCGNHSSSDELVITNPNYPNPDDDAGNCNFRLLVNSHHVCQIRVEFRDSRMLLPRKGNCLHQYLTVSESTSAGRLRSPVVENKFCGFNSDQHFYVELTQPEMPNNTRHVDFKINTKAAGFPYRYSMIVSQINCDLPSPNKAPTGCFQYFNSRAGVIKSFNFEGGQYWNNQNYRICVQTIDNSCTLALSSTEGDFGIHKARSRRLPANRSGVGMKACPRDYLWIPGTIQSEEKNLSNETHDRYCGSKLSDRRGDFRHRIVTARMYNSVHVIIFHTGTPRHYNASQHGPGFRIDFEQMSECPSQAIHLNNYSYTFNSTGTDAALVNEEDDYYDEADDDKEVVHLSSNNKRSFE